MFFCPEPRSIAGREENVRDQKLNLLSLQRKQLKKKRQKEGMNLLRLSHGHWTYKNSEYYFFLG